MLQSFRFEHFRAFLTPTKIELRPITLLFGYNNSGKSALVRGAASLLKSLRGYPGIPWTVEQPLTRGATFGDLTSTPLSGKTAYFKCGIEFTASDLCDAEWTLRSDGKRAFVSDCAFKSRDGGTVGASVSPAAIPDKDLAWLYDVSDGGTAEQFRLVFEGLRPKSLSPETALSKKLIRLASDLPQPDQIIQWLGASRLSPPRQHRAAGSWTAPLGHDGTGTLDFLISESDGTGLGPVGKEVSAWFETNLKRRLKLEAMGDRYDLKIEPFAEIASDLARAHVCLADAGEGLSQVLPVLVSLERAKQAGPYAPRLLCVEEPESHLHPRYHAALADAFCKAAAAQNPPAILAETHSENLLLRIQLAVAKKELPADRVAIYWVRQDDAGESKADLNTLDELGRPQGNWPPMVFGEDLRLARELAQIQRATEPFGRPVVAAMNPPYP
jgi:hypothetical protein